MTQRTTNEMALFRVEISDDEMSITHIKNNGVVKFNINVKPKGISSGPRFGMMKLMLLKCRKKPVHGLLNNSAYPVNWFNFRK